MVKFFIDKRIYQMSMVETLIITLMRLRRDRKWHSKSKAIAELLQKTENVSLTRLFALILMKFDCFAESTKTNCKWCNKNVVLGTQTFSWTNYF